MSLGIVRAQVILHDNKKVHCGPEDPIEGYVRLRFLPSATHHQQQHQLQHQQQNGSVNGNLGPELFGPAQIWITLQGRLKVKLIKRSANSSTTYRARIPLFAPRKKLVLAGPVQMRADETRDFPFRIFFPAKPEFDAKDLKPWDARDGRFDVDPGQPLPPSMSFVDGSWSGQGESHVQYQLKVDMRMPGIDVAVQAGGQGADPLGGSHWAEMPVTYEPARIGDRMDDNQPRRDRGTFLIKDKALVSDPAVQEQLHGGFRGMFRHRPACLVRWALLTPTRIRRGQPFVVQVSARPDMGHHVTTVTATPRIKLERLAVSFTGFYHGRTETNFLSEPDFEADEKAATETVTVRPGEPELEFSPANDWTQAVALEKITRGLGSSFKSVCVNRAYQVKVKCWISVAGKQEEMQRAYIPVVVYPPLSRDLTSAGQSVFPPPPPLLVVGEGGGGEGDDEEDEGLLGMMGPKGVVGRQETLPAYRP